MTKCVRWLLLSLCAVSAFAKPRLVPSTDASVILASSSNPNSFRRAGAQVFFIATDRTNGPALWSTDGTTDGTRLVFDPRPGTRDSGELSIEGVLDDEAVLFRAFDGVEWGLWRSDGTPAGTWRVTAFPPARPDANGYSVKIVAADTRVFLLVHQSYGQPYDLWASDGLSNDARKIATLSIGSSMIGVAGKLYFLAADDVVGSQFWVSDGTLLGTRLVAGAAECAGQQPCNVRPQSFGRIGSRVLFGTDTALWTTDGTSVGTNPVSTATTPSPYFVASSSQYAYFVSAGQLWRTDGTNAGTSSAGPLPAEALIVYADVMSDGRLPFLAYSTSTAAEVWRSDGSAAGTTKLGTFTRGSGVPSSMIVGLVGTSLLLNGSSTSVGSELWRADMSSGAVGLLKDIDARVSTFAHSGEPQTGATLGSQLLFPATDARGRELWKSDGTAAGTQLVANIASEATAGSVSGTIVDASSGLPVAGANVLLCTNVCESPQATTDANGRYRFEGVIPGMYSALGRGPIHLNAMYAAGSQFTVAAGFETQQIDFSLQRGGTISGSVIRATTGQGVTSRIYIRNSAGQIIDDVYASPPSYTYRSRGLTAGGYTVEAHSQYANVVVDQLYNGIDCPTGPCNWAAGEQVILTAGMEANGVNFALRDYGKISGTIRDSTSPAGLQTSVRFVPVPATGNYASVHSNYDGAYESPFLVPGNYRVVTSKEAFPYTAHPNVLCPVDCSTSGGTVVTVGVATNTTGVDVVMTPKVSRLTGTVRSADGTRLSDRSVVLVRADGVGLAWSDVTDVRGYFEMLDIPPGTYYLQIDDELYPDIACHSYPCNPAGAMAVTVRALETTNVELPLSARMTTISGRVSEAGTQAAILNLGVGVTTVSAAFPAEVYSRTLSASGEYSITVLSRATSFYVSAISPRHHHTAYPSGRVTGNPYVFPPSAVALPAGTHTGIDFTLPRIGSISGRAVDARTGGSPLRHVLVWFDSVTDDSLDKTVWSDPGGSYRLDRAEGAYYIRVDHIDSPYRGQIYNNIDCNGTCAAGTGTLVTVPDGQDVTGINFSLQPKIATAKISGRVLDDLTGLALAGVRIDTVERGTLAYTDAQGNFTSDYLPGGSYKLFASPAAPYYYSVYGGAHCNDNYTCNFEGGTPVQLDAPTNRTGVDFRLIRLGIASVSPASGPTIGGTLITITGRNFTAGSTVQIGGRPATVVSLTPGQITARTPWGAAGLAHVTVKAGNITISLAHAFTYQPIAFTDASLAVNVTQAKAAHIVELRNAINAMRTAASLPPFTFTDADLSGMPVRGIHLLELRTALNQARTALGLRPLGYTNALTAGTPLRAIDLLELRSGVQSL